MFYILDLLGLTVIDRLADGFKRLNLNKSCDPGREDFLNTYLDNKYDHHKPRIVYIYRVLAVVSC